ncbi:MAG: TldD/PmbA family protein [Candidatus Krumholzibacteriota bacterium]|nr:TldD/PmbA family protein [Candidatus Krumholzibacteriota bacterium]
MRIDAMEETARRAVQTALAAGADTVEAAVVDSEQFDTTVRSGGIETLTESRSSRIALSVSVNRRKASVTSSDLSRESIARLVAGSVELARLMDEDEFFGLPDPADLGETPAELDLVDDSIARLPADEKIARARRLEETAIGMDDRVITDGASFTSGLESVAFANSLDFCGSQTQTFAAMSLSLAAGDAGGGGENTGKRQSSYWYTAGTHLDDLESIEEVAGRAVERTIRKLGGRKPATCEVPVVFDPITATAFLSHIASAVGGGNIYRKSSFLVDRLGERIAAPGVTIVEDPLLPRRLGSRLFDSEGVRTRKTVVVAGGVLETYLMSVYQARKLGLKTTGSAGGHSNIYMEPGERSPEEIIAGIGRGLYLTSLFGPGANWSTGDFSQGGQGLWIEDGRLAYPVNEFTIAGTFDGILGGIAAIADDLVWRKPVAAPTFMVDAMTVSGT